MSPSACFCPRRNKGCKSNREEPPPASRPGGSASQDRGLRDQSPGVRPKGPSRRLWQHPSPLRLPLGCSAGKQPEMPLAGERTPPKRGVGAARGVADAQREQRAAMAGRSRTRTRAPPTPRPSFLTTGRARWEQVARSWAWLGLPGLEGSSWGSPPPAFSSPPPLALFAEGPSLWAVTVTPGASARLPRAGRPASSPACGPASRQGEGLPRVAQHRQQEARGLDSLREEGVQRRGCLVWVPNTQAPRHPQPPPSPMLVLHMGSLDPCPRTGRGARGPWQPQ